MSSVKTLIPSVALSHVLSTYSQQLSGKSFVIIRIPSLVESNVSRLTSKQFGFGWNAIKQILSFVKLNDSNTQLNYSKRKQKKIC